MRTVERKMIDAIRAGKSARLGSTVVEVGALGNWKVLLHGNRIADGGSHTFNFTLAGWPTNTTRSRLNALLSAFAQGHAGVLQQKHKPYFRQWGQVVPMDAYCTYLGARRNRCFGDPKPLIADPELA